VYRVRSDLFEPSSKGGWLDRTVRDDTEDRFLSLLPYASKEDRIMLYSHLASCGGSKTLAELVPVVQGDVRASAEERAAAIQALGKHPSARDLVGLFARALRDRDLFVQLLALMLLRRWDAQGEAREEVAAWLERRLKNRRRRRITDFTELPMALAYFDRVASLRNAALLFVMHDDQIVDPVERRVLDHMWPQDERKRWALDGEGQAPNLDGVRELGHAAEFYLSLDAQEAGIEEPVMGRKPSAEDEAEWTRYLAAEIESRMKRLERRRNNASS